MKTVTRIFFAFLFVFIAIGRAQSTPAVDPAFKITPTLTGTPTYIAVDLTGKVLCFGGDFVEIVNGHAQRGIARFNADGSLDQTFDCGVGFAAGGNISNVFVQSDGKILVTGGFTIFAGSMVPGIVRLNSTGGIDSSFAPVVPFSSILAMDSHNCLIAYNSGSIVRLTTSGSLDSTFSAFPSPAVIALVVDRNDKVLFVQADRQMVMTPASYSSTIYNYDCTITDKFVRLNTDGSRDFESTLNSAHGTYLWTDYSYLLASVKAAQILPTNDGGYYLEYSVGSDYDRNRIKLTEIVKHDKAGAIDPSFSCALNGSMFSSSSGDGLYLFSYAPAGDFLVTSGTTTGPIRLLPTGTKDITFDASLATYSGVAVTSDGRLLVATNKDVLKYVLRNHTPFAPTIASMPAPLTYVVVGVPLFLNVAAIGTPPLQYSWYRGTTLVSSTSGLSIYYPQLSDSGDYTVVVTNSVGSVTSNPITISVQRQSPTIITQPASQYADYGSTVTFSVGVTGLAPLSAQWYKDGSPLNQGIGYSGAASGTLQISPVSATSAGAYSCVITNSMGIAQSAAATLTLAPSSILINLSVRTTLGSGQKLIPGFVTSGSKVLLMRAAGPTLNQYGLIGLPDPLVQVYDHSSVLVAQNDNWDVSLAATFSQLGAFPFSSGSKDSALITTSSGPTTVFTTGVGLGSVLFELYDTLSSERGNRLINVSARNQVGSGADALIVGFVIDGVGSKQLLIRGVGPKLLSYGVTGVLADPFLQVYNSSGAVVASGDNWDSGLASTFTQVGAFALNSGSKDAAILITLPVGVYSVKLTGVNNGTGEGLLEVYEVWP